MTKPIESAEEFAATLDAVYVPSRGMHRVRAAELIESRDVARDKVRDRAVRLEIFEELERIAANSRWADDRNMLTGVCKLLRAKFEAK